MFTHLPVRYAGSTAALMVLGLTGCTTSFYDAKVAGSQIESALALPAGRLRVHGPCDYGVAGRAKRSTEFFAAACAMDAVRFYIVEWDDKAKTYRRGIDLAFSDMPTASFLKAVQLGSAQLNVPVDGGVLAVSGPGVKQWHDALVAAGVEDAPAVSQVRWRATPSPTPIVIYLPVSQ